MTGTDQVVETQAQLDASAAGTGALLAADAIAKINAGAALTFAVWSLPKAVVTTLMRHAPTAFITAYDKACQAYGVGGR